MLHEVTRREAKDSAASRRRAGDGLGESFLVFGVSGLGSGEIGLARRRSSPDSEIAFGERRSQRRLWLFVTLGLLSALVFKQLAWLPIPLDYLPRQILALAIFAGGLYLRYTAVVGLGRFFTTNVAILHGHRLVEDGPYRVLRHPAYTGLLIALAAAGLAMGDGLALLSVLLPAAWRWRGGSRSKSVCWSGNSATHTGRTGTTAGACCPGFIETSRSFTLGLAPNRALRTGRFGPLRFGGPLSRWVRGLETALRRRAATQRRV